MRDAFGMNVRDGERDLSGDGGRARLCEAATRSNSVEQLSAAQQLLHDERVRRVLEDVHQPHDVRVI